MRITHISDKCIDTLALVDKIRHGSKLDLGFFEVLPDTITVIAGRSGSGKSLLLDNIRNKIFEQEGFCILSFELEMLAEYQIIRSIASKESLNIEQLINETLDADKIQTLSSRAQYYVDHVSGVDDLIATCQNFVRNTPFTRVVITIDHALLVDNTSGEKVGLDNLMIQTIKLKKLLASCGKEIYFVILSQLNRNIESDDRVINPFGHLPKRSDIHGSSAIFTAADYVFVIHSPSTISGMADFYTWKKLPTTEEGRRVVWIHQLKNRFGSLIHVKCLERFDTATLEIVQTYDDRYFSDGG